MFKKLLLALATAAACTSAFAEPHTPPSSDPVMTSTTDPYLYDPYLDPYAEDACSRDGTYCSPPKPPK